MTMAHRYVPPHEPSPDELAHATGPSFEDGQPRGSEDHSRGEQISEPVEKEPDSPWWVVLLSAMFLLGSLFAFVYFLITGECPVESGNGTCLDEMGEGLVFVAVVGGFLAFYSVTALLSYVRRRRRDRRHLS
ncbi:MAG TPA: hypothetical protein VF108_13420 [Actinomycetota bacterium]